MLLALSVLSLAIALGLLHAENNPKRWHLERYLLTAAGFFAGVGMTLAAWWAYAL